MSSLPLSEKYRPKKIDEMILPDIIKHTFQNYLNNKNMPHLLFYGPPGSGKTSSIIRIAERSISQH